MPISFAIDCNAINTVLKLSVYPDTSILKHMKSYNEIKSGKILKILSLFNHIHYFTN